LSRRLLYIGPSGIGDWCFILGSLEPLMALHGCDVVDVLLPRQNHGNSLLTHCTGIDRVLYLHRPDGWRQPWRYPQALLGQLWSIRRQRYQAVAVSYLSVWLDTRLVTWFSGAPVRVTAADAGDAGRVFSEVVEADRSKGKVAAHLAYAGPHAVPSPEDCFAALKGEAAAHRQRFELDDGYVVLGVGGGRQAHWKYWPAESYAALVDATTDRQFVLLGGGAVDRQQADDIIAAATRDVVDLVDATDMLEAHAILAGAAAVVGNDSGIANLAALQGVPTVCIYGATDPANNGPALLGAQVVRRAPPCAPCFTLSQCPDLALRCPHRRCLSDITPADVGAALDAALLNATVG
jgi:ADP-heptose:LPS heptosyltransferase